MQDVPRSVENCCGRCGRFVTIVLVGCAVACSVLTALSCSFYQFSTIDGRPSPQLSPPYASSTVIEVGLFSYRIVDSADAGQEQDSCVDFPGRFSDFSSGKGTGNDYWIAAQYCVAGAASLGVAALLLNLVETLCCSFYCSYLVTSALMVSAGVCQACTFLIFADHTFCLQKDVVGNHSCEIDDGAYLSSAAVGGYLLSGILLGCIPRPDPCFGNVCCRRRVHEKKDRGTYEIGDTDDRHGVQVDGPLRDTPYGESVGRSPESNLDGRTSYIGYAGNDSSSQDIRSPAARYLYKDTRTPHTTPNKTKGLHEYSPDIATTMRDSSDEDDEYAGDFCTDTETGTPPETPASAYTSSSGYSASTAETGDGYVNDQILPATPDIDDHDSDCDESEDEERSNAEHDHVIVDTENIRSGAGRNIESRIANARSSTG